MLIGVTPAILRPLAVPVINSAWNPADNSTYNVLTNSNRTITKTSGGGRYSAARATKGRKTGETGVFQFEITMTALASPFVTMAGLVPSTQPLGDDGAAYLGDRNPGYSYESDGFLYFNGANQGSYPTASAGTVIGIVADLSGGAIRFYHNGSQLREFSAGTGINFFPAGSTYQINDAVTINTGQSPFSYPVNGAAPWG